MKRKRLLRFYFFSDSLNAALDNLITETALVSMNGERGGEYYAEKICGLLGVKCNLSELWNYLDGVMRGFTEKETAALKYYGATREGLSVIPENARRAVRSAAMKFTRKARHIYKYPRGIELVNASYYCLISVKKACCGKPGT